MRNDLSAERLPRKSVEAPNGVCGVHSRGTNAFIWTEILRSRSKSIQIEVAATRIPTGQASCVTTASTWLTHVRGYSVLPIRK